MHWLLLFFGVELEVQQPQLAQKPLVVVVPLRRAQGRLWNEVPGGEKSLFRPDYL
jgi:hypothetical protein